MKILIVNTSDINGGAARAANRLHNSLNKIGIDSSMLVLNKNSDNFKIIGPQTKVETVINLFRKTIDQLPIKFYPNKTKTYFSVNWLHSNKLIKIINEQKADIVHLHWINDGMLRIEDLTKINAPIIWSLHDMWPFTGGCHYDEECGKFENECRRCKVLQSNKEIDLSNKIFMRKKNTYKELKNLTVIGLSSWLYNCSKNSSLLKNKEIVNLPNPIDVNVYKKLDKEIAREIWNLPKNKKLILFGAIAAKSDPRKGFIELENCLSKIEDDTIEFIVFGSSEPKIKPYYKCKIRYLGMLNDDISLVTLYNAVDVMVVPSLQENLSNAIMESLSCGTPVVAFDIGGNSDLIEHKKNGYLVKPYNIDELKIGIEWILHNENYQIISENARKKVLKDFDEKVVSLKYKELYLNVMENVI